MKNSETKEFVAYEYLSINVKSDKEDLYIDCYLNFGWRLTNSNNINNALVDCEDYYINANLNGNKLVNLKFKRELKLPNKDKVIALQKKCDMALKEVERLEKEPTSKGIISSLSVSIIGTIFLAISVFSITATNPLILICIITGIIGLFGWGIAYPLYKKVKIRQENINNDLIKKQYDIIYDACFHAKKLID